VELEIFMEKQVVDLVDAESENDLFERSFKRLKEYCEKEGFKGWDPYDGLNSKIFQAIPFIRSNRVARLAWIQLFKRSPVNLRRIALVPKAFNNKGNGLFLAGYCKEYLINPTSAGKDKINYLSKLLIENASVNYSGSCWGYNFDWQARAFFQPKNTPTVVATTFISNALLDAYEITKDEKLLATARSSCNFILKDLNRTYDEKGNFAFSYSPLDKSVVFNASLLGCRLLARVYSFTGEKQLIEEAKKAVAFCCDFQRIDGSWGYGTLPFHQWVDNFHTGYNLECISDYMNFSGDHEYEERVEKGFKYYVNTFFTDIGIPMYYNNSIYPIDIHAPAQLVITLAKLNKFTDHKGLVDKVLNWTINNMQSEEGYFYYQINKYFTSHIPYIRWAQAWMFHALTTYLFENKEVLQVKNDAIV
jgi:rhamnogalacturonyl hydrolase YesR